MCTHSYTHTHTHMLIHTNHSKMHWCLCFFSLWRFKLETAAQGYGWASSLLQIWKEWWSWCGTLASEAERSLCLNYTPWIKGLDSKVLFFFFFIFPQDLGWCLNCNWHWINIVWKCKLPWKSGRKNLSLILDSSLLKLSKDCLQRA